MARFLMEKSLPICFSYKRHPLVSRTKYIA